MMTGPHTPEARARISATLKGRKRPPEVYEAMRARSRATMAANWQDPAFLARWQAGREKYRASRSSPELAEQAAVERQQQIADMRATGATFKEIGRAFGISMNRAYVLHRKHLSRTQKDGE